jgi:hypothetical protein
MAQAAGAHVSSQHFSASTLSELDVYAAEFAKLVAKHTPRRTDTPSEWLGRIPDEAFRYYQHGLLTFGREAEMPIERRGRLYLIHTSLLFMWMTWGRETARKRFRTQLRKGTRRASSLVKLEYLHRTQVLADYDVPDWFYQPVDEWTARVLTEKVDVASAPNGQVKEQLRNERIVECRMPLLSSLQTAGVIPSLPQLQLK